MKKILRNRKGMTLAELLVAFSLLVLIVFVFTPMLLQSYDTIYKAGEREQEALAGKTSLEEQLAIREETNLKSLKMNFTNFTDKINIIGRKVVYDVTSSSILETLFHGARASVRIISPSTVYDDTETQKVIIQTKNISFGAIQKTKTDGSAMTEETRRSYVVANNTNPTLWTNPGNKYDHRYSQISICAYAPDKPNAKGDGASTALEENVYGSLPLNVQVTNVYQDGRIALTISSTTSAKINFTNSPVKIVVYYYDEDGGSGAQGTTPYSVSDYLYIQPMTLLLGGKSSSSVDYVTSAGMVTESLGLNNEGDERIRTSLTAEGREIPVDNSKAASSYDLSTKGVEIQNISWIDNDDTDYYDNYYVMTGTNGTIMRMYVFNSNVGIGAGVKSDVAKYNGTIGTTDKTYRISSGTEVYPALWSGDYSHQFGYSTFKKSMGYRWPSVENSGTSCWYTQDGVNGVTGSNYKVFSVQAKLAYYYNGWRTGYGYSQQNGRRISFVLTESGYPIRVTGNMADGDDYKGYNEQWEINFRWLETRWLGETKSTLITPFRIAGDNNAKDKNFGFLNMKALTSVDPSYLYNDSGTEGSSPPNYIDGNTSASTNLTVTGAVYDKGLGGMYYVGSKDAYALIRQNDNTSTSKEYAKEINTRGTIQSGTATVYYFAGKGTEGTSLKKVNTTSSDISLTTLSSSTTHTDKDGTTGQTDAQNFFINRSASLYQKFFTDIRFSFGFASNREKTYSEITVLNGVEQFKSYEKYYYLSHYGDQNHKAAWYSQNSNYRDSTGYDAAVKNTANDDYYNVWFPGEFYNLNKVVSKEGVSVGVGFSVSGSTFQWVNPSRTENTSTAMGSLFNDGVLAVKLQDDEYFKNKLYFKDNGTFDSSSLSGIEYKNTLGTYGTHSRRSVQFTAVDLVVEENNGTVPKDADGNYTGGDVTNSKDYIAFYGDNTGRVFRSKVASATVTGKYELKNGEYVFVPKGSYDAAGNFIPDPASDLAPVPFVKDLTYAGPANSSAGQMEEIVLSNGNKAKDYFTKIVTITASNDLVVISGESASNTCYVIIGTRYNKNAANESAVPEYEWNWRAVPLSKGSDAVTGTVKTVTDDDGNKVQQTVLDSANTGTTMVGYKIKDAVMVNGYYYAVGSQDSSNSFILAADLDSLKYDPGKTSTDNNKTIVTYYHTIEGFTVNCIGGHNTQ